MVRFSLSTLSAIAISGALLASGAVMPAHADEPLNNLGPVGPHEPIVIAAGGQRVLAFYRTRAWRMRRERHHLEGGRTGCAFPCPRQPEARSDVPARWCTAPVDQPLVRRRRLDACPRRSRRADPHRRDAKRLARARLCAWLWARIRDRLWVERGNSLHPFVFHRAPLDIRATVPYLFKTVNCGDGPQKSMVLVRWHALTRTNEILRIRSSMKFARGCRCRRSSRAACR